MSVLARPLLQQAVKAYQEEDGASVLGSYRDAITDILHLALKDKKTSTTKKPFFDHLLWLRDQLCSEGFNMFEEELRNEEINKVTKMPYKNLPLHSIDEFEFPEAKQVFEDRLKSGGKFPWRRSK